jgi:DNA helicase IV
MRRVRRTRPVRAAVDAIWPKADPVRLVLRLLSDPARLAQAADGLLDDAEQEAIRWDPAPRGPASARWSPADAVLVDEAGDLIERTPSLAHVVLDEAQDLSPMECRAIGRQCATGSATVLGDPGGCVVSIRKSCGYRLVGLRLPAQTRMRSQDFRILTLC